MRCIRPKNATHCYAPPKVYNADAVGAECESMYAIVEDSGDTRTITSIWMPSAEELKALNAGHGIMLVVIATNQPPVMLDVTGEPVPRIVR